jgi:3,4-dihydroxy-9,10-secoandrosta-1,3,5(10)-triene-9,17-dione 4,5-dioxygenase
MDIRGLAYVVADAADPAAWRRFGSDVLGMVACDTADGGVALKMDERAHRILVRPAPADRYAATGWEVAERREFLSALDTLRAAGTDVKPGTEAELASRQVQDLASFRDPAGNRHELVWGFVSDFARFVSPQGVSRFVTGDLGMGHTVLPAPDFDRTQDFFTEVMGFGLADILVHRPQGPGGPAQRIHFFHCNNGRHHSLALFEGAVPSGCVHMMVEVPDMDEVGRALDRVARAGARLTCTLGRHVNDLMTSFYVSTPSGFSLEFGYGGRVMDWDRHIVFESGAVSLWGHDFSIGLAP